MMTSIALSRALRAAAKKAQSQQQAQGKRVAPPTDTMAAIQARMEPALAIPRR